MKPARFPEANFTFTSPPDWPEGKCCDLPVFRDGTVVVSAWQPDAADIARILAGSPVFLTVWAGGQQPPVALCTGTPFLEVTREQAEAILENGTACKGCAHFTAAPDPDHAPHCTRWNAPTVDNYTCPQFHPRRPPPAG